LELPGVLWAVAYWPSEDGDRCPVAAAAGAVPQVLQGFELPLDRLPPPIVRALLSDTIEQGRLSVLWLNQETGLEVTEDDLAALKGLSVIPLRLSSGHSLLLLIGTETRNPNMGPFVEFRAQVEGRFAALDGLSFHDVGKEHLSILEQEFNLLSRNPLLFRARLAVEITRAQRYTRHLSLLTFRVGKDRSDDDHESLICEVADALRRHLRLSDLIGRADTDVVGVVLPEASESHALWVFPRLERLVHECLARNGVGGPVDVGIACRPVSLETPDEFIFRAINTPVSLQ
jgi:hypothetical protein